MFINKVKVTRINKVKVTRLRMEMNVDTQRIL